MNDLATLQFDGKEIASEVDGNGIRWYVFQDVLAALEYEKPGYNVKILVKRIPEHFVNYNLIINYKGSRKKLLAVNREGIYYFLQGSNMPKAQPFRLWLAEDVVPEIVDTGSYHAPVQNAIKNPILASLAALISQLDETQQRIELVEDTTSIQDHRLASLEKHNTKNQRYKNFYKFSATEFLRGCNLGESEDESQKLISFIRVRMAEKFDLDLIEEASKMFLSNLRKGLYGRELNQGPRDFLETEQESRLNDDEDGDIY